MAEINKILFKRGLETNRSGITPAAGEPIWVTDNKKLFIGDGTTAGGIPVGLTINLDSDGASPVAIGDGDTLDIAGGAGITTSRSGTEITVALDITGEGAATALEGADSFLIYDSGAAGTAEATVTQLQTYMQNNLTFNDYNWNIDTDDASPGAVADNATLTINGAGGIVTSHTGTTVDVTLDFTGLAAPVGGVADADTMVIYDTTGATNAELTMSALKTYINAAAGSFSSFTIVGDTGTEQVDDGETVDFTGGSGISTAVTDSGADAAPYFVTIDLDIIGLAAATALEGADSFAIYDSGATQNREATVTQLQTYMDANLSFTKAGTAETITGGWTFGTAQTTFTANTRYNDNVVLNLGTGDDVKHFFNATSYITELESVNWILRDNADAAIWTVTESTRKVAFAQDVDVGKDLVVTGDLTVNGTTTTVNSTTVTVDDPIFTLGGDTAPVSDDNKDRGIEFRWYDGAAKTGFFGFDDSTGKFTFIPDGTNTSEVYSGTLGDAAFNTIESTVTTGTAPFVVASTTVVTNLNADTVDGQGATDFTLQYVSDNGATTDNAISITNTTASTSSSTGALIVSGGIGVALDIYGAGSGTSDISGFTIDGGTF